MSFSLLEPQDQENFQPIKKRRKGDGGAQSEHAVVTYQCRNTQTYAAMKPDVMETLTCIICQELLHDCETAVLECFYYLAIESLETPCWVAGEACAFSESRHISIGRMFMLPSCQWFNIPS